MHAKAAPGGLALWVVFVVGALAFVCIWVFWPLAVSYWVGKLGEHKKSLQYWGPFGDLFGALNTLFAGLILAGVIANLILHRAELQLAKQQYNAAVRAESSRIHTAFLRFASQYPQLLGQLVEPPQRLLVLVARDSIILDHELGILNDKQRDEALKRFPVDGDKEFWELLATAPRVAGVYATVIDLDEGPGAAGKQP